MNERERLINWAKQLADPNWCLSVPKEAKDVITQLVKELEPRTITTVEELDALLNGDANVVLLDEDGISLQNLAGGWQAATGSRRLMHSDLTFHCFGPTFTVLHEEVIL